MFDPKIDSGFAFNQSQGTPQSAIGAIGSLIGSLVDTREKKPPSMADVKAQDREFYFSELDKGQQLIAQGKTAAGNNTIRGAYRGWTSKYGPGTDEDVDASFTNTTGISVNVEQFGSPSNITKIMETPDYAFNVELAAANNPGASPQAIESEALRVTQNKFANDAKLTAYQQGKEVTWTAVEKDYQQGVNLLYENLQGVITTIQADSVITPDEAKQARDWYRMNRAKFQAPPGVADEDWKSFESTRLAQVDEIVNVTIGAATTGTMTNDLNRALSQIIDKAIIQGKLPPALRIQLAPKGNGEYGNALEILGSLSSEGQFGPKWQESIDTALAMDFPELLDWVTEFPQKGPEYLDKVDTSSFSSMSSKTKVNSLAQDRIELGNDDIGKAALAAVNIVEKVASLDTTALTPALFEETFNPSFYKKLGEIFQANPAVGEVLVGRAKEAFASQETAIMLATNSMAAAYGFRLQKDSKGQYDFLPDTKLMTKAQLDEFELYFGSDWSKVVASGGFSDKAAATNEGGGYTRMYDMLQGLSKLKPNVDKFNMVLKGRSQLDQIIPVNEEEQAEGVAPVEESTITRSDKGGSGTGFVGVSEAGAGYTVVETADGTFERREGTRAWRNNNPGNIEYGEFAKSRGAVGTDGRFAVFATYEDGRNAKRSLLWETKGYAGKTIAEAINRYAPPSENNTNAYAAQVAASLGVPVSTPMSSLNPGQREIMLDAMERVEGFKPGKVNGVDAPAREPSVRGPEATPIEISPFDDAPQSSPRPDATMASGATERAATGPLVPLATPALEEDTRAYLESIGALKEQAKQTVATKPMDASVKALIEQLTAALDGK